MKIQLILSQVWFQGGIISIYNTPFQVIKVGVMTSKINTIDYIKYIYKKNGIVGFYKGFIINFLRDSLYRCSFIDNYYYLKSKSK